MREIVMSPKSSKICFAGVRISNHSDESVVLKVEDGVIGTSGPVVITWEHQETRDAFESWLTDLSGIFVDPVVSTKVDHAIEKILSR